MNSWSPPPDLEADGAATDHGLLQRLEVRDARGAAPRYTRRRLLFRFPELRRQEWADHLDARLAKLAGESHVPHVRRPLEMGEASDGAGYVLIDRPHQLLSELLAPDGLIQEDGRKTRSWRLIADIIAGLAALHRLNLYHGGFSANSVSLDRDGRAWIDDAGWGPLWYWSNHGYLPEGLQDYLPKDAEGRPAEPAPCGDVYALGILSLRLLLGQKAPWPAEERREALLSAGLRRAQVSLILRMLNGADGGLRDARDVQAEFSRLERPFWRLLDNLVGPFKNVALAIPVAVLVLTVFIASLFLLASRTSELERRTADLDAARVDLEALQAEHKDLHGEKAGLKQQVDSLESERLKLNADLAIRLERIKQLEQQNKELLTDDAKKLLAKERAITKQLEQERDDAEARRRWLALAYAPELTFKAMNDHILQVKNLRQKELLQSWLDEFERPPAYTDSDGNPSREKWWITLQEGKASKDAPTKWRMRWNVWVKVGAEDWHSFLKNHDWKPPTQHVYPEQTWHGVPWSPGQPIRVQLVEVGHTYDTTRIDRVFDGPVALWQLHNARWLFHQDGEEWVGIKLGVWKCPGPSQR